MMLTNLTRIAFLALILVGTACQSQRAAAETETAAEEPSVDTVVVVMEPPAEQGDSLLIAFEKTPCFGRCPVYKIKVYRSGFATYEGINFAERMGLYSAYFSEEEIADIFETAKAAGYLDFQSEYDDPRVTDLPSTISTLVFDGEKHRVKARMDIPPRVKDFHENLAVTLAEKAWKPYDQR